VKILFLRFSSIGDIVITSSVVRCVRNKFPEAHIGFASKKGFASLLEHNPNIDSLHLLESDFESFISEIKKMGYTHVIDLHKNLRTKRIKSKILNAKWYSYKKLNWQKWLLVNFKINRLPKKHITHRYFEGLKELGVTYDNEGMNFYIPEDLCLPKGIKLPSSYVVYAIGGTYNTKKLPYKTLAEFVSSFNGNLVLIGGKEDWELSKGLKGDKLINLCGKLSILESAEVVRRSTKVIAHDSGFMHIAAALNKPLLSIWGNTVKDFGFYPLLKSPKSIILEKNDLSCRPCSKLGHHKCPKGHFKCMDYSVKEINKVLSELPE